MKNWKLFVLTSATLLSFVTTYKLLFLCDSEEIIEGTGQTNSAFLENAILFFESSIDESFPQCEDFYKYACQGWFKERVATLKETKAKEATRIFDWTKENHLSISALLDSMPISSPGAEGKLKQFYTSCTTNWRWKALRNYLQKPNDPQERDVSIYDWLYDRLVSLTIDHAKQEALCSLLTHSKFPLLSAKLVREMDIETISSASEISNRVLQTVKQSVKSASDWSPTPISMNTRIGFGSDALLDPNYLNNLYSYLPLDSNDLLGNLEKVDKFNNYLESVPALGNTITAAKQTLHSK
ncbi:Endothelin-converting enzyme-like 1 [Folsomia candida]|uniref:Endothelin-converting enzyme-like 1 n=1 Tax=Folsomia candida TaxID=158441 RepID=A0A226DNS8_FOLCA|nr:Endothelin-converting enzyme-like 1 [Folsomia candida]